MMGHLNSFSASGGGNLNKNFARNSNARGGGMLKLRFDWYITVILFPSSFSKELTNTQIKFGAR